MSVNLWRRVAEDALALISSAGKRLSRSTPQELRIRICQVLCVKDQILLLFLVLVLVLVLWLLLGMGCKGRGAPFPCIST